MAKKSDKVYEPVVAGVDWRRLEKGDVIPRSKIEEMWDILYGERRKRDPNYLSLNVKEWLVSALGSIGKNYVLRESGEDLHVLTDEESVGYLNSQATAGLRKHRANTGKMFTHVDVDNLSQFTADQLESNQARHALIAAAADGARRQAVKLKRAGAKLPKLMPPDA